MSTYSSFTGTATANWAIPPGTTASNPVIAPLAQQERHVRLFQLYRNSIQSGYSARNSNRQLGYSARNNSIQSGYSEGATTYHRVIAPLAQQERHVHLFRFTGTAATNPATPTCRSSSVQFGYLGARRAIRQ